MLLVVVFTGKHFQKTDEDVYRQTQNIERKHQYEREEHGQCSEHSYSFSWLIIGFHGPATLSARGESTALCRPLKSAVGVGVEPTRGG